MTKTHKILIVVAILAIAAYLIYRHYGKKTGTRTILSTVKNKDGKDIVSETSNGLDADLVPRKVPVVSNGPAELQPSGSLGISNAAG